MNRIFVDMDGVLAKWEDASLEEMTSPGFFASRKPDAFVVNGVRRLCENPDCDVYILSSYLLPISKEEKIKWNELHTDIPEDHQIYVKYGEKKSAALQILGGVKPDDVLLDDFSRNLHEWEGIGVKLYNGINGTHGTWNGFSVHNNMKPDLMAAQIIAIAKAGKELLIDKSRDYESTAHTKHFCANLAQSQESGYRPRGR